MRKYSPIHPPGDFDPRLSSILKNLNNYLKQVDFAFGNIQRGEKPVAGGSLDINQLSSSDHNALDNLTVGDVHTHYLNINGRTGGQTAIGSTKSTLTGADEGLILKSLDMALAASGPANIRLLDEKIYLYAGQFHIRERESSSGINFSTGTNFVNAAWTGSLGIAGGSLSTTPFTVDHGTTTGLTVVTAWIRARSGQTGNMLQFRDSVSSVMSYIRASDGAFVGPVAPTSGAVPDSRQINTTAPLTGGGALTGDLTLDIDTFTSSTEGTVPASGGGTTNFLRADGSWAAPPGGAGGTTSISRLFAMMGA